MEHVVLLAHRELQRGDSVAECGGLRPRVHLLELLVVGADRILLRGERRFRGLDVDVEDVIYIVIELIVLRLATTSVAPWRM